MRQRKRITKTEIFLLALSLAFAVFLLITPGGIKSEGDGYTVTVQYQAQQPAPVQEKININTATASQLEALDGIGPALAERIVAWRTEHGPFQTTQDLLSVRGIGETTLNNILNQIILEDETNENTGG